MTGSETETRRLPEISQLAPSDDPGYSPVALALHLPGTVKCRIEPLPGESVADKERLIEHRWPTNTPVTALIGPA